MEKLNQDGLETLAKVVAESNKEENLVKMLLIWKGECCTPKSATKCPYLTSEWIDILRQKPLQQPNFSTPLFAGLNLFQRLLWENHNVS